MPSDQVRAKALQTLDNLKQIVENERLIREHYVADEVDLEFTDAICGGHKACLLGSTWIAYGIKPRALRTSTGDIWHVMLDGINEQGRHDFLRYRPALKLAYNALNDAAARIFKERGIEIKPSEREVQQMIYRHPEWGTGDWPEHRTFESFAEELFERGDTYFGRDFGTDELLKLVASARREVAQAS